MDRKKIESSFSQVQAIGMYGAAQPDFFKSETNGGTVTWESLRPRAKSTT